MCIISGEIESVTKTKIFCGVNREKNRQLTVYANSVKTNSMNNAMILPVVFPESLQFHNLQNYSDFFSDCNIAFNTIRSMSFNDSYITTNSQTLKVISVGSYHVSVAMNLSDLQHINRNVFTLTNDLGNVLQKYYSQTCFGFIICQLHPNTIDYHPFAYSHNILQQTVFIPTRHYHNNEGDTLYADDWDHDIYLYNCNHTTSNYLTGDVKLNAQIVNRSYLKYNLIDFDLDQSSIHFTKLKMVGKHVNRDLQFVTY
jgi:hypothetical protein